MGIPLDEARLAAERTAALADGPRDERILAARALCGNRLGRKQDFRRAPGNVAPSSREHAA